MALYDVIRQLMSGFDLNVVSTSISPLQDVRELHALSPPLAGRYTLGIDYLLIIMLLLSNLGFCTGLLHSYITGGLGSLTVIIILVRVSYRIFRLGGGDKHL